MDRIDYTIMITEILDRALSNLSSEDFEDLLENLKIEIENYD